MIVFIFVMHENKYFDLNGMCEHNNPTARKFLEALHHILYSWFNQIESVYFVKHNVAVIIKRVSWNWRKQQNK